MSRYDRITLDSSETITVLNLNEFDVTEFLEFVYPLYRSERVLKLNFFGDCEFRFIAKYEHIYIVLNTKNRAMWRMLRIYPGLVVKLKLSYCYDINFEGENLDEMDDFEIIRDLWSMHKGFTKIDLPIQNISFQRLAPVRLSTLCHRVLKYNSLDHLPVHVAKRLKRKRENPFHYYSPE